MPHAPHVPYGITHSFALSVTRTAVSFLAGSFLLEEEEVEIS
jgi:hypothetical protein